MNTVTCPFEAMDKEILFYITSWLEAEDIVNFSLLSRRFKFILLAKSVWTLQVKNYLPPLQLISDKLPKVISKDFFMNIFKKYASLKNYLSTIINKVNPDVNARKWLENNYKYNHLKKKEIENIIIDNYHCIPMDYYILFRLLDGQDMLINYFAEDICFFGGYSFNDKYYEFEYLPLTAPEFPFLQRLKFHTLAINRDRGFRYYVDFQNVLKAGTGSIFSFLNQRNENGSLIFRVFLFKKSIFHLLEDLQLSAFSTRKRLIDHFDTLHHPQSDLTTEGIKVRVSSIFNPWEMSSNGFLFAYQIRVSSSGLKGKWKLTCRHLIITDGYNQEEVEGVELNKKPYDIYEGGEDFLYESWINTQSLTTSMKGYLYFVNIETKQEIRAQIGEITMEFPKGCSLVDFNQKDLSIKILIDRREDQQKKY